MSLTKGPHYIIVVAFFFHGNRFGHLHGKVLQFTLDILTALIDNGGLT